MTDNRFTDISDDPSGFDDEPTDAELDALSRILGDTTVWNEPDPALEDLVIAAIAVEADRSHATPRAVNARPVAPSSRATAGGSEGGPGTESSRSVSVAPQNGRVIDGRHRFRPVGIVVAAAAVVAVVAIGWGALRSSEPPGGQQVALSPTDLAPSDAQADLLVTNGPGGTQILLDVRGLPAAPGGFYYQAWMRQGADVGVSVGTFHLRGGDTEVELWGGVSLDEYPIITVTLQQEGAGPGSSGKVVLSGRIDDD